MQVFVLGMHRSGTSIASRLLNMCGLFLGAESELMESHVDNPTGFWERRDVYDLNEEILREAGSSWDMVLGDEVSRLNSSKRAEFSGRIAGILEKMNESRNWLIKDPRLCTLFPMWRGLLQNPVIVFVSRNPAEIAASLESRNGLSKLIGIALWESYSLAFLKATRGLPRIFVRHRDLLTEPYETIGRLRENLEDLSGNRLRQPDRSEVEDFIDPRLFRSRVEASGVSSFLNDQRKNLFRNLASGSPPDHWAEIPLSQDSREALSLFREFRNILNPAPDRLQNLDSRIEVMSQELDALASRTERGFGMLHREVAQCTSISADSQGALGAEIEAIGSRIDDLAKESPLVVGKLVEDNRRVRDQLEKARNEARIFREHSDELRRNLDSIHNSRMWRFWMKYQACRRFLLHPFSRRQNIETPSGEEHALP